MICCGDTKDATRRLNESGATSIECPPPTNTVNWTWRLKKILSFTRITSLGHDQILELLGHDLLAVRPLAFDSTGCRLAAGGHSAARMIACTMSCRAPAILVRC